ncbi:MAG: peptidase M61 [Flavobacteriaceae bacterium]|nr:peptidase M61 [Flavobacteriaceae bacterium]
MRLKILAIIALALLLAVPSYAGTTLNNQDNNNIDITINLSATENDRVPVTVNPGRFQKDNVTYRLPKVVQGTYSVSDFGKFVEDFKAIDYSGNELEFTKTDTNTWVIPNGSELDYITYYVNDTFDIETMGGLGGDTPFSPAGTNIEEDNYVLNLHGFIGYFDSLKNSAYNLDVTAPADFVRTSALETTAEKENTEFNTVTTSYYAPRYFDITDNPMMYGKLSVEEFDLSGIKVVLSVFSPNGMHSATSLKETMATMMQAQKTYLGDLDSTPRYDIYLYLSEGTPESPKGFGALEHHTSTVVVMPEAIPAEGLSESLIDIVSHEFFHIVSPLSIHSEDVHYFDYHEPTFSKHLWMYEGVTEYFANHFQVYEGLISEEEFYANMMGKIQTSRMMNDSMSFTEMSENVLAQPYARQYYNVYQKGALIGMCIDILMREESDGQRGILSLMKELSNKYGKNKPFEDDSLFDEITALTFPSIREFLDTHVAGTTPIDYDAFFAKMGLEFVSGQVETNYIQNGAALIVEGDPIRGVFFNDQVANNSFWAEQGVQSGDVIKAVDGVELTMENANDIFQKVYMWQPGTEISVKLEREGEEVLIETTTTQSYTTGSSLQPKEDATEVQVNLRKAWLKG